MSRDLPETSHENYFILLFMKNAENDTFMNELSVHCHVIFYQEDML